MDVPGPIAALAGTMAGFGRTWALCGGWGLDGGLGRQTREHVDVDVAIDLDDQLALHEYLRDGWLLNGHDELDDDSTTQWDGHELRWPSHVHARGHGQNLDVQLERRIGDEWLLREVPPLLVPVGSVIRDSPWGVPILAPEVTLFFKGAGEIRGHDEADFRAVLPALEPAAQTWLRDALAATRPEHPWLSALD